MAILYLSEVQSRFIIDKIKRNYYLFENTLIEDFFTEKDLEEGQSFDVSQTKVKNYKLNKENKVDNVNQNLNKKESKSTFFKEEGQKNGKINIEMKDSLIYIPSQVNTSISPCDRVGLSTSYLKNQNQMCLKILFKEQYLLRKSLLPRSLSRALRSTKTETCDGTKFVGNYADRVRQLVLCMWNSRKTFSQCPHWSVNYG